MLSAAGFASGFMLYAAPEKFAWFNPFAGILFLTSLPFAGAMTAIFGVKDPDERPKNQGIQSAPADAAETKEKP